MYFAQNASIVWDFFETYRKEYVDPINGIQIDKLVFYFILFFTNTTIRLAWGVYIKYKELLP